jgi:hypothetical protein
MANNILATYSPKDVNVAGNFAFVGAIVAAGIAGNGLARITVTMTEPRSHVDIGMDGAVIPSAIPGNHGEVELQVWQTSTLHHQLLAWYNACQAAMDAGDVSQWFGSSLLILSVTDGSSHVCTGVGPMQVPPKSYDKQADKISWKLICCNIQNQ